MSTENIVKLNIGGTIFQTSKSTLAKRVGFFKTMLETDVPLGKDENGAIFIDRPAKHFELILSYMRDGDVDIPNSEEQRKEIMKEAQYYLLVDLVKLCTPKIRYLNGLEECLNAIANCKKKGVINVQYEPTSHFACASKMLSIVDAYSDQFDVYFTAVNYNRITEPHDWTVEIQKKGYQYLITTNPGNITTHI